MFCMLRHLQRSNGDTAWHFVFIAMMLWFVRRCAADFHTYLTVPFMNRRFLLFCKGAINFNNYNEIVARRFQIMSVHRSFSQFDLLLNVLCCFLHFVFSFRVKMCDSCIKKRFNQRLNYHRLNEIVFMAALLFSLYFEC